MRFALAIPVTVLLAAHSVRSQNPNVDLLQWTVEDLNGSGPWVIDAPRLFAYSTNTVNTDCSVLYSDFSVNFLEFRMSVDPAGGDDDIIGFVLGWNPGDGSNPTADYVLVDWKKVTQSYQNWGTAQAGLALSHVSGAFTRGYGNAPIDLWSHTGVCTELVRGTTMGQTGWEFGRDYVFQVLYLPGSPGSVDVWLDGRLELHAVGTFNPGRFGCYDYSQSRMEFQFPLPGSFASFGSGCRGSSGTPYLFSPETPLVGHRLPIILANLPPSAMAVLLLGLSSATWQGVPLPLDLTTLGAAGCSLLTSSDVFLPVPNFNGTAYVAFNIPSTALPGANPALYVQGMALDPAANPLGAVLSNGAATTIGIR